MAAITLTESNLAVVKKMLRKEMPDIRSSHLTEALAAALRRKTHASLRPELRGYQTDPPIDLLDDGRFDRRLQELGYPPNPDFSFELFDDDVLISTTDPRGFDIEYKTRREKAWRNLMVCAINEAIQRKLISLRPHDNCWPQADNHGCLFDFALPNELPARGYVEDAGFGELRINAAVNPKGDWVRAANAGFHAGDAFALGWIERERGAWLQSSTTLLNCRRVLLAPLASLRVDPIGYGDHGQVIM